MLWIVFRGLSPRLTWVAPTFVPAPTYSASNEPEVAIELLNSGRRNAVDVSLHAELRVQHAPSLDNVTNSVIRLPLNSSWVPRLRRKGRARIRIEPAKVPIEDWDRLKVRAGISRDTLPAILAKHNSASVRLYALASDPFSGSRQVFVSQDLTSIRVSNQLLTQSESATSLCDRRLAIRKSNQRDCPTYAHRHDSAFPAGVSNQIGWLRAGQRR